MQLAVIADDFTGAMDTGVQFSKSGISTLVITLDNLSEYSMNREDVSVLAIDTESRFDPPDLAYRKVCASVRYARELGIQFFYKKIDSAMRGNIGKELEAFFAETSVDLLPLVPAYPANRRCTIDGKQYVEGVPVNESKLGKDPFSPVRSADICEIIREQSDIAARSVSVDGAAADFSGICIFDASTEDDMEKAASHLKERRLIQATAGCAGFAEYLPSLLGLSADTAARQIREDSVLLVCGSVCEVSIEQMALLKKKGYPYATLNEEVSDETILKRAEFGLKTAGIFILESIESRDELPDENRKDTVRNRVKERMSFLAEKIVDRTGIHTVFVIGGETLQQVIQRLGLRGIYLNCELLPGIPLGYGDGHSLQIISKSGGLGDESAVDKALSFVMGSKWLEQV